jgi:hypothetical protein
LPPHLTYLLADTVRHGRKADGVIQAVKGESRRPRRRTELRYPPAWSPVSPARRRLDLGCVYVDAGRLADPGALHPTWTHGSLVQRSLSGVTRVELVRHGFAVLGRPPATVLPAMTDDDVRRAARAELCGPWAQAVRRPLWWLNPVFADLGLTSMARGRHVLQTGQLLTKTQAIERARAPAWLKDQLRARRQGQRIASPRTRTALIAWQDARRTVASACRPAPD